MSDQVVFDRTLASLHDAMFDDTRWPATSALIDEACGLTGNTILIGEGPKADIRVECIGLYYRGQRRTDLERWYLEEYHPIDERIPRFRQLPDSRLVPIKDLYTDEELKSSPVFNEALFRGNYQNGLNVRLDVGDGCYMSWALADPLVRHGWAPSQTSMVKRLLPHLRQYVRVRQALMRARAIETTAAALLENRHIGVIHLDRRGRVLSANDRGRHILRDSDGLLDRDGVLRAFSPGDQPRLDRLVTAALPTDGKVAVSGSMPLRRAGGLPPLAVHIRPMSVPQPDYGVRRVAALVLLIEPARPRLVNPGLVAEVLGLTAGESQMAVWLAEGKSVDEIARATGRTKNTIYWHLKQTYQKLYISRQADLVRLVLSVAELE